MEEEIKGVSDYLDVLKRHRKIVIYPAIFLILVSAAVSLLLPASYKSTGLILIESQEIPNDLVRTTVTSYADQRIAVIKQKLMTTSRVMGLVKKYNLYSEIVKNSPASVLVDSFRENMSVDMVQANVTDSRSGRSKRANIAFNVSFMNNDPIMAQKIANELTTQFLNENVKTRTARANETRSFLKEEGDKFQRKIELLGKKIADFKEKNNDSLPALLPYNLSMVEKLEDELVEGQNQVMVLKDQILTMSLELANLDTLQPVGSKYAVSPDQQLSQARAEYVALQGKYSKNHPDIKRLKRQIDTLEKRLGNGSDEKSISSSQHKSPLFLKINSKISSSEREIKRIQMSRKFVNEKINEFQKRVAETHQVELEYESLIRDYKNNSDKYQELRGKELQAELAQNLETENKGESFTLIEPPLVPNSPEKPNRPKIFIMGVIASIALGVGLALLFEMIVGGVYGYKELTRIVGVAPLVVVPLLTQKTDSINTKQKWYVAIFKVQSGMVKLYWLAGLIVIIMLGVHFFVMDFEIIWFKVLRKISML